ncbi:MAG: hypothetical protein M1816_006623 [Peltula sp. TS41687]|nr:MAG: hypothetical protein M1816_006623 [Peltula sp. TS41687]
MPGSVRKTRKTKQVLRSPKEKPGQTLTTESDQDAENQILFEAAVAKGDAPKRASRNPNPSVHTGHAQTESDIVPDILSPPPPRLSRPKRSQPEKRSANTEPPKDDDDSDGSTSDSDLPIKEEEIAVLQGWKNKLEEVQTQLCKDEPIPFAFRMQPDHNVNGGQQPRRSSHSSIFPLIPKTGLGTLEMAEEATQNLFHDMGDLIPPEFRGVLPEDGTEGFKRRLRSSEKNRPTESSLEDYDDVSSPDPEVMMTNANGDKDQDDPEFDAIEKTRLTDIYYKMKLRTLRNLMESWATEFFGHHDDVSGDASKEVSDDVSMTLSPERQPGPQAGGNSHIRDQFSKTLIEWIQEMAGRSLDWWPLIKDGPTRKFIALGLLAKVVADYVFGLVLFGATPEQEQAFFGLGELLQEEGVPDAQLQKWISLTVRLMWPTMSSVPRFDDRIKILTNQFTDKIKPLLRLQPDLDPFLNPSDAAKNAARLFSSKKHTERDFTDGLQKIFHTAAVIAYEMRSEPRVVYTLESMRPGSGYDSDKMVSRYKTTVNASVDIDGRYVPTSVRFVLFPALVCYKERPDGRDDEQSVLLKPEVVVFRGVIYWDEEDQLEQTETEQGEQMETETRMSESEEVEAKTQEDDKSGESTVSETDGGSYVEKLQQNCKVI